MCDQVVSLISSEHAKTIIWSEEDDENVDNDQTLDLDQDESDRMFTFEVAQTNEQEESVTVREGFKVNVSYARAALLLTKLVYDITTAGCFKGHCTSGDAHRGSGPDGP